MIRAFIAAALMAFGLSAHATNYFSWGAECTAPCTNNATGTLAPPIPGSDNFSVNNGAPGTTISTAIKHSGASSMRIVAVGNDGGNQPEGAEPLYQGLYGTYFPGTFSGSTRYYRWWMRMEPGWSWGNSGIGDPVIKVIREGTPTGQWFTVLMSPSGFQFDDCDDDGVGGSHAGVCWTNTGLHGANTASQINVNYSHPTDGVWREYVLKIKQPTSFSCTPGAGCDSAFTLYINGTQVSTNDGWKIVPDSGTVNAAGMHFAATTQFYLQIRSSVAAGGTIYLDDFSLDNVFNSTLFGDTTAPTGVVITAPSNGATVSGNQTVTAVCTDETAISNVQMLLDGSSLGASDTSSPYSITWDTTTATNGSHTLSARCADTSGNTTTSSTISVTASNADVTPPARSGGTPTGVLAYGTTSTSMTINTLEAATCKYGTSDVSYASLPSTFSTTGGTTHSQTISGLTNGSNYTYYIRCSDAGGSNTTGYPISWSVSTNSTVSECNNYAVVHPTWIWCDNFETDRSASWWDYNAGGATAFARSSGNGLNGSFSMRSVFPNTTGAANGGDFKIVFGDTAYTPNVKPSGTDITEAYWRVYVKNATAWNPGDGWKFARFVGCSSSTGYCPNQTFSAHYWQSNGAANNPFLGVDPASGVSGSTVVTTTWNDFANYTFLGASGGVAPIMSNARSNTWQCIEGHLKLNTLGASDGVQELWVDGVLDAQKTNLNLRGSYAGTYNGINMFSLENYENSGLAVTGRTRDLDNLVISTDRIGCAIYGATLAAPTLDKWRPR